MRVPASRSALADGSNFGFDRLFAGRARRAAVRRAGAARRAKKVHTLVVKFLA